mmetsp:Transcript_2788/g.4707  ORF Transcript_2788/g.4707 Transcript_2788/m.4707 type:complete len:336 (-) Transcript_2788:320-1327(-)
MNLRSTSLTSAERKIMRVTVPFALVLFVISILFNLKGGFSSFFECKTPTAVVVQARLDNSRLDSEAATTSSIAHMPVPPNVYTNPIRFCPMDPLRSGAKAKVFTPLTYASPSNVIDVGAYDGEDAFLYANAGHVVYTFEPVEWKAKNILARIKKANMSKQIVFRQLALSNWTGETNYVSHSDNGGPSGPSSYTDSLATPWNTGNQRTSKVRVDTLDNIFYDEGKVFVLMKIDAQGHDAEVLAGAAKLLQHGRIQIVVFEVSPYLAPEPQGYLEAVTRLASLGYLCFDCNNFRLPKLNRFSPSRVSIEEYMRAARSVKAGYTDFVCISSRQSNPRN